MTRKRIAIAGTAIVLGGALAGGGAVAIAGGGEEGLEGPQADRAINAALDHLGGGSANGVELDSEQGATYEVEVTKTDGSVVDVRLDENFGVVAVEGDSDASEDEGQGDGDND